MNVALTPRQADVLRAIRDLTASKGYPPTVREISSRLGFKSHHSASVHIEALVAKGVLLRDPNVARSLRAAESATTTGAT